MKTSWKRCIEFSNMAQSYLTRTKGETKLKYAITRTLARIQKHQDTVNETLADIEIDHCLTEKRGDDDVIVRDAHGNLQYTKDEIKKRNKATREFLGGDNIDLDPYFASALPADLNQFEVEAFSGFVINPEEAELRLSPEFMAHHDTEAGTDGSNGAIAAHAV